MTEPIIFISRNRVKNGMLGEFMQHYQTSVPRTQAEKPSTFAQLAYVSEDGSAVDIIRLFSDAQALDAQLQGADDRSKVTYQYIEPVGVEIYGTPSDFTLDIMKHVAGSGIEVCIRPRYLGGFIRPNSG